MAEWLCSGLQLRVRRFDSDSSLHFLAPRLRPGGEIGRLKGLKTLRHSTYLVGYKRSGGINGGTQAPSYRLKVLSPQIRIITGYRQTTVY